MFMLSIRQASMQIGIDYELLKGAVKSGYIPSDRTSSKKSVFIATEDVMNFKRKLEECFGKQTTTGDDPSGVI